MKSFEGDAAAMPELLRFRSYVQEEVLDLNHSFEIRLPDIQVNWSNGQAE